MLNKIYIISYFGVNRREKRKYCHHQQLDWCFKNNLEVIVYPQFYNDDEYVSGVTYLDHTNNLLLPAEARNICLKHFYNTNDDFAIFADNDSILYTGEKYCDSSDFVEKFNKLHIRDLNKIDYFFPLNPGKIPFTKMLVDNKKVFDTNFVFSRNYDSKGSFAVLKNLRKFYNLDVYYDEVNYVDESGKIIPNEDVDFAIRIAKQNLGVFRLDNIILKECGTISTWATDRGNQHKIGKAITARLHNLPIKNNRISYRSLHSTSNKILVNK